MRPTPPASSSRAGDSPTLAAFGETRRRLLETLKRRGSATLREASAELGLTRESVREHVNALAADDLVARSGVRRAGPGRPEIVYRLTPRAGALFPQRESQVLAELAGHLLAEGGEPSLRRFFEERAERRLGSARARLAGLKGRKRLAAVARVLSEEGYMAEVVDGRLRLAHCPLMGVVAVTRLPCRAELSLVEGLLGRKLERTDYLPEGGASCSYRMTKA